MTRLWVISPESLGSWGFCLSLTNAGRWAGVGTSTAASLCATEWVMSAARTPPFVLVGTEGSCCHINEPPHWWATCVVLCPVVLRELWQRRELFVMMLCFVLVPHGAVITSALSLDNKKKKNVSKVVRQKKSNQAGTFEFLCFVLLHFLLCWQTRRGEKTA